MLYQLVKIPTSLGEVVDVEAENIEEVRAFALANVDKTKRWIIKLQGRNIGEAFEFTFYTCYYSDKPVATKRNHWVKSMFATKEEAIAARNEHRAQAASILETAAEAITKDLNELGVTLGYCMEGDTYGIHSDYQFLSVEVNGYRFEHRLFQD